MHLAAIVRFLLLSLAPALSFAVAAFPSASTAEEGTVRREDELKAAYLFNFMKFVAWPSSTAADQLVVCFRGGDGVYQAFAKATESRRIGARRLIAQWIVAGAEVRHCDASYAGSSDPFIRERAPSSAEGPVLTVSDSKDFVQRGGMIELFSENERLRFIINVGSARRAGLRIDSELLRLAIVVDKEAT